MRLSTLTCNNHDDLGALLLYVDTKVFLQHTHSFDSQSRAQCHRYSFCLGTLLNVEALCGSADINLTFIAVFSNCDHI